jgi:hypothetical protein
MLEYAHELVQIKPTENKNLAAALRLLEEIFL